MAGEGKALNLLEAYEMLPLSERTIIAHGFSYKGLQLVNDTGHGPCFYRILDDGRELGAVYYYRGRKLASYVLEGSDEVA